MHAIPPILLCLLVALNFPPRILAATLAENPPTVSAADADISTPTYKEWAAACRKLPTNRSLRGRLPGKELLPLKEFRTVDVALSAFFKQSVTGALRPEEHWVGEQPGGGFFNTTRAYFEQQGTGTNAVRFQPFAQKLSVPAGSEVFFRGDLHGDIHSLIRDLAWLNEQRLMDGFKIARTNFYMVFLGDYTDRGLYGSEVLYTILRLKLANPDRLFLARGNHEDLSLQLRYGFFHEGRAKFGTAFNQAKIARAFDFLPVVIYLESGGNVIQCNHGGMEPGYDPRALLAAESGVAFQFIGALRQQDFMARNPRWLGAETDSRAVAKRALSNFRPEAPTSPSVLGFMWNDFTVLPGESQFAIDPGRAFVYGQEATGYLLKAASTTNRKVQAVFRAHQHAGTLNPMMRRLVASQGLHRHWQSTDSPALLNAAPAELKRHLEQDEHRPIPAGSVWTFNVSPDSAYGEGCGFTFDTFGILKTAAAFSDWRVRVVNLQVGDLE